MSQSGQVVADVAHALLRAASRLFSTPGPRGMTRTPCQRTEQVVEMSLDTARRSACATSATNLAPHGSCSFLIDSGKPVT